MSIKHAGKKVNLQHQFYQSKLQTYKFFYYKKKVADLTFVLNEHSYEL